MIQFHDPIMLAVGAGAIFLLLIVFKRFERQRAIMLSKFASSHLIEQLTENISERKRWWKRLCFISGVACLFIAVARPHYGFRWQEVKRKGIDILIALDTSKSMLATDIKPNRLERAKLGITDFVMKLGGDRVGLMPFAGGAHLMCPMTMDYAAFLQSLDSVDTTTIPEGGTDIANVINQAQEVFKTDSNFKILVLITDGEDLEGSAIDAAKNAAKNGVKIYTVGVGSPSGELIPVPDGHGGMSFLKDSKGNFVKSRLDEKTLTKIAQITKGAYEPLGRKAEGLEKIYKHKLDLVPKKDISERMKKVPLERFEWPLVLGIILLIIEFLIGDRKNSKAERPPTIKEGTTKKSVMAKSLVTSLILTISISSFASPKEAKELYDNGDYKGAVKLYKNALEEDPKNLELKYNYGTASYKAGDYKEAQAALTNALQSEDLKLQALAYYNLGNTTYKIGEAQLETKPKNTVKTWERAIELYKSALKLNPKDNNSKRNIEVVSKKLEKLKKILEQQKKKQDKKNQQNQKNKQDKKNQQNQKNKQDKKNQQSQKNKQDKKNQQKKKDKQDQNNKQNQQNKQNQKNKQDQKGKAKPAQKQKNDKGEQQAAAQPRKAGEMSKEEAQKLLDSLKDGDKQLPIFFKPKDDKHKNKSGRDW